MFFSYCPENSAIKSQIVNMLDGIAKILYLVPYMNHLTLSVVL
jgi:hypothetical protein